MCKILGVDVPRTPGAKRKDREAQPLKRPVERTFSIKWQRTVEGRAATQKAPSASPRMHCVEYCAGGATELASFLLSSLTSLTSSWISPKSCTQRVWMARITRSGDRRAGSRQRRSFSERLSRSSGNSGRSFPLAVAFVAVQSRVVVCGHFRVLRM